MKFDVSIWAKTKRVAFDPVVRFYDGLSPDERTVLYTLLAGALVVGFIIGRRRPGHTAGYRTLGAWRFPSFQNSGEARVSRLLRKHFSAPDYHLMNHVTIGLADGTTQVDHILISRFGVFVLETKNYTGWLFANASDRTWTQVLFHLRFQFQNPIFQNRRHVRAVREQLDFLPPEAVKSVVVFTGDAQFKTDIPEGVVTIDGLVDHLRRYTDVVMSTNRVQFSVGRLETARLAISGETDVEHLLNLERRFGSLQ